MNDLHRAINGLIVAMADCQRLALIGDSLSLEEARKGVVGLIVDLPALEKWMREAVHAAVRAEAENEVDLTKRLRLANVHENLNGYTPAEDAKAMERMRLDIAGARAQVEEPEKFCEFTGGH